MFENKEGQKVPSVTFRVRENDEWKNITSDDLFKGKNVILLLFPEHSPPRVRPRTCRAITSSPGHLKSRVSTTSSACRSTTPL